MKKLIWFLALVLIVKSVVEAQANLQRLPNFLFILADDLGWSDLGCYGNTFHESPRIDRLAEQGMRFTNAYAASPVCYYDQSKAYIWGERPEEPWQTVNAGPLPMQEKCKLLDEDEEILNQEIKARP